MTNSTGKVPGLGSAAGRNAGDRTPATLRELAVQLGLDGEDVARPLAPGLGSIPPKPLAGNVSWKLCSNSGSDAKMCCDLLDVGIELLEGGVGGHVERAEDDALVLVRRRSSSGEKQVDGHDRQRQDDPDEGRPRAAAPSVAPSQRA